MGRGIALVAIIVVAVAAITVAAWWRGSSPAPDLLPDVAVTILGHALGTPSPAHHRLTVVVSVRSPRDLPDCLRFALDEPFASRLLTVGGADPCLRPRTGDERATLVFDGLTDDDVRLISHHVLLWGAEGGRCGRLFDLLGVCSVDTVGSIDLSWPVSAPMPTFRTLATFQLSPLFSFDPGSLP